MELSIFVDEKNFEIGIREILGKIRKNWAENEVKYKVSLFNQRKNVINFVITRKLGRWENLVHLLLNRVVLNNVHVKGKDNEQIFLNQRNLS